MSWYAEARDRACTDALLLLLLLLLLSLSWWLLLLLHFHGSLL